METWVASGQDPSPFWDLTYREIDRILAGAIRKIRREHEERGWAAWTAAYLNAYAPAKSRQFPPLDKIIGRERKRQTAGEMVAAMQAWMAKGKPN